MVHDDGIDGSWERSSVGVVDAGREIVAEARLASEPEALVAWLRAQPFELARIGLAAGPLPQWLFAGLRDASLPHSCGAFGLRRSAPTPASRSASTLRSITVSLRAAVACTGAVAVAGASEAGSSDGSRRFTL